MEENRQYYWDKYNIDEPIKSEQYKSGKSGGIQEHKLEVDIKHLKNGDIIL